MGRRKTRGQRVSPLTALADLNVALADTPEYRAARRAILARFARLDDTGKPVLCEPPIEEQRMGRISGAFKVIYDTEKLATDSARELSCLGGPPQASYTCERGDHQHLKTLEQYRNEKKRSTG